MRSVITPTNCLKAILATLYITGLFTGSANAQEVSLNNPGFENGRDGWTISEKAKPDVSLSNDSKSGSRSIKILRSNGIVNQTVSVEPNSHYKLSVSHKGLALVGVKVGERIYFNRAVAKRGWKTIKVSFNTDEAQTASIFLGYGGGEGRYDDVELRRDGVQGDQKVSVNVLSKSSGGSGLSSELPPGKNFDLLGWNISVPTDTDRNGKSDTIKERELSAGYESEFFYTGDDGGMVFKNPIDGYKTSKNTSYTRTELREMLRRGNTAIKTRFEDGTPNKNNWVFSSAPLEAQIAAGAVDGILEATLAVNHVTTTGKRNQVGRVIIGQIHAKDDEPIRLYYRKLPENTHGSIYAAHESQSEPKDIYYEMIGTRSQSAENPENGIKLNEKFSYKIDAKGNSLFVTISKDGIILAETTIDMTKSGYDVEDDYMYFKAGVYNQNNSGDPEDYVQATFYKLKVTH